MNTRVALLTWHSCLGMSCCLRHYGYQPLSLLSAEGTESLLETRQEGSSSQVIPSSGSEQGFRPLALPGALPTPQHHDR